MFVVGGYTLYLSSNILAEPFWVDWETKSPNYNPKLEKFCPLYYITALEIIMNLLYFELSVNIIELFIGKPGL